MSLFDFFFPEQAQASHLRSLANSQANLDRREFRKSRSLERADKRLDTMEEDIGFVALVLGALLQKADEKGVLTRDEIRDAVSELDAIDGVKDGRLDVNILRGLGQ